MQLAITVGRVFLRFCSHVRFSVLEHILWPAESFPSQNPMHLDLNQTKANTRTGMPRLEAFRRKVRTLPGYRA